MAHKQRSVSGVRSKDSKSLPKLVTIEEDYLEWHGQIYYAWREEGGAHWHFKLTSYKQLPYIKWVKLNEIEYEDKLRRIGLKHE